MTGDRPKNEAAPTKGLRVSEFGNEAQPHSWIRFASWDRAEGGLGDKKTTRAKARMV
jgi:hypothetical protein